MHGIFTYRFTHKNQPIQVGKYICIDINPLDPLGDISFFGFGFGLGFTPWKINMDHNDGGLEDHFPFLSWVMAVGSSR